VTACAALAAAAASAAVLGAWELLAAVESTRVAARIARALEPLDRAGREGRAPTAPERRRLGVLAAGCLLAAGWLLGGPALGALAALAGPVALLALLRVRAARYRDALRSGAAGAARALADAVAAGRSVRGAVAEAAPGLTGAAGRELRLTARALAFGEPTEAALERLRRRAACRAWDTIVAAVLLQREAGGDLPALLRELAGALEAADRAEQDARTTTAQARFTARLVLALPLAAAVLAELGSPGFLASLLSQPMSASLAGLAAVLQLASVAAIRRIARPVGV
jgi:tight adherence protein B